MPKLFAPLYFQLLDLEVILFVTYENRHHESLASCIQDAESIPHVGTSRIVGNIERMGRMGTEKGLDYLPRLVPARIARFGNYGYFKIVRKP